MEMTLDDKDYVYQELEKLTFWLGPSAFELVYHGKGRPGTGTI